MPSLQSPAKYHEPEDFTLGLALAECLPHTIFTLRGGSHVVCFCPCGQCFDLKGVPREAECLVLSHTASLFQLLWSCLQGGTELQVESSSGARPVLLLRELLICIKLVGRCAGPVAAEGSGYCCLPAQTWRPPLRPYAKARPRAAEDSRGQQVCSRAQSRLLEELALVLVGKRLSRPV